MQCRFDTDLLQQYVDGSIGPLETIFTEEHLKVCPKCNTFVIELRLIADSFEALVIDPDLDRQLVQLATQTADSLYADSKKMSLRTIIEQQRTIVDCSTMFLQTLPGSRQVAALGKKVLRTTPKALWQASRGLVVGGVKLARVWA